MKIAVVGATGPTGLEVVKQSLAHGHHVVAYVRRPEALSTAPNLKVVGGELFETEKFANAIKECDVLICTLGNRSFKVRNFMAEHLPLVTNAMETSGVTRIVLMSALGGGELPGKSNWFSRPIFKFMSNYIFKDRTISERKLASTNLNWCAVYPAFLTDGPKLEHIDCVDMEEVRDVWGMQISRATVASVLIDLAEDNTRPNRRVAVAAKGKVMY